MTLDKLLPKTWNPSHAFDKLFQNDPEIASQALSDVFILATVYLASAFLIAAVALTIKSLYRSRCYRVRLKKVSDYASHRESLGQDKNLPLFRELNHHLIEIPLRNGSSELVTRRTIDAEEIFSDAKLAPGLSTSRIFQTIPVILTGLGVLGTFVGLQLGIGGLDLSNLKELDKSIIPLIQGCAIAFSTSVWGVGVSLIFGFLEKLMEGFAIGSVRKLQHAIDAFIPRYVPEEAMADLARSSRGSEDILKNLAVEIGGQMQIAVREGVAETLRQEISSAADKVVDSIKNAFGKHAEGIGKDSAKVVADALKDELSNITKSIDSLSSTVSSLKDGSESVCITVANAVTKLNAHEEVMSRMSDASANIKQAAESFASMNGVLESSANLNKEAAEAQNDAAKANQGVAEKLSVVGEKMPEMRQTIEEAAIVIGSLGAPIASLKNLLAQQREREQEHENRRTASEGERSERLIALSNDLANTVTKAVEEFAKVGTIAEQLSKAAVTLDEASNELAVFGQQVFEASKEQRSASEASRDAALASRDTTSALTPLPAAFRELTTGLEVSGSQLRQGIESAVSFQQQWLKGVEVQLIAQRDSLSEIVTSYGTQMEGQTRQLIEQWTTAVNECLGSFDAHIERIEDTVETLDTVVSNIRWEE